MTNGLVIQKVFPAPAGFFLLLLAVFFFGGGANPVGADELSAAAPPTTPPPDLAPPRHDAGPYTFSIYFENDGTFVRPYYDTDRHYTNGIKLALAGHPDWADDLARAIPFAEQPGRQRSAFGVVAGQNMYTPSDLTQAAAQPNDRPWAGWLYGGVFLQRSSDRVMDHFEIDLGAVGPSSLAKQTQRFIHETFSYTKPMGWDNQIHDEIGFNLIYQRHWKIPLLGSAPDWSLDALPQAGFTLGTVNRDANLGVTARLGWNMPDDFGPANIANTADYTGKRGDFGWYFFARVNGKAVEHNLLYQGNTFRNSPGVGIVPLVGELQLGFEVQFCRCVSLMYSWNALTHEFRGQNTQDSYGSVILSVSWGF